MTRSSPSNSAGTDRSADKGADNGLVVDGLACRRGGRWVFQGLSFRVAPGGAMVVTGANGSGKSSLLRLLAGLLPPYRGRVAWNGANTTDHFDAYKRSIAYVGHLDAIKPAWSVFDNLAAWAGLFDRRGTDASVADGLAAFALEPLADLPGRYLSAGQKRRLALARLLVTDARLWLLDEPTTGLDARSTVLLETAMMRHRIAGGTIVLASHAPPPLADPSCLDLGRFAVVEDDLTWSQD